MAGYVNKAIIVGNLGRDPEIRTFQDGNKIANMSVATTEKWKDKNSGEMKERTEWHRVSVRQSGTSKIIDSFIELYVFKGAKVYIEGKIETRKWQDQDGNDRYSTEIICSGPRSAFELLDSKKSNGEKNSSTTSNQEWDDEIPL